MCDVWTVFQEKRKKRKYIFSDVKREEREEKVKKEHKRTSLILKRSHTLDRQHYTVLKSRPAKIFHGCHKNFVFKRSVHMSKNNQRNLDCPNEGLEKEFPEFWCEICEKDLQSIKSLREHVKGKFHLRKSGFPQNKIPSSVAIDEHELFVGLRNRIYRNVVVLTGAGVSTAAGVPDFRSPGGLFESIRKEFGFKFPFVHRSPEILLSREFANKFPDTFQNEVLPLIENLKPSGDLQPTATHKFCEWLYREGLLRRIYTQNVDGLHLHHSLNIDKDMVVECHGSISRHDLVLYGDDLPQRFYDCCCQDFPENTSKNGSAVDLIIVFGTSLQVLPFKAVPNLAPRGCTRVMVNRCIADCNDQPKISNNYAFPSRTIRLGSRRLVTTKNLWTAREGNKRWAQLLVESECDAFVERFFSTFDNSGAT